MTGSIFESGSVYCRLFSEFRSLSAPCSVGGGPNGRALWILAATVLALVMLDFAFDDTRFEDIPFFVVAAVFLFGLGLLARMVAKALAGRSRP